MGPLFGVEGGGGPRKSFEVAPSSNWLKVKEKSVKHSNHVYRSQTNQVSDGKESLDATPQVKKRKRKISIESIHLLPQRPPFQLKRMKFSPVVTTRFENPDLSPFKKKSYTFNTIHWHLACRRDSENPLLRGERDLCLGKRMKKKGTKTWYAI